MNPIYEWGAALTLFLALCVGCWVGGDIHGSHKAELDCANNAAASNAAAIADWKKAMAEQNARDDAARKLDADASKQAVADAKAVADRFAAMKIAVVKMAPAGACKLSPDWVKAYNGAK